MAFLDSTTRRSLLEPSIRRPARRGLIARQVWTVVGMYALSRVYSSALIAILLWIVLANGWSVPSYYSEPWYVLADGAHYRDTVNFFTFSGLWDGEHYNYIFNHGYPVHPPVDGTGAIAPNPWAFLPVYPLVVKGLSVVTGFGFFSLGTVFSMVCGLGAAIALYFLVHDRAGHKTAQFVTALFAFGPLGFLLQTTYAESLFFLLMFSAMLLFQRERYWLMTIPASIAAFTRPGEVALAAAVLIVFCVKWWRAHFALERVEFPWRQRIAMIAAGLITFVTGMAWPVVGSIVTGLPGLYMSTELSWRVDLIGYAPFVPFAAPFEFFGRYTGAFGVVFAAAAVAGFAYWLFRRRLRRLGMPMLATVGSYALYLFAVVTPTQSFLRLCMPLIPMFADPAIALSAKWRRVVFYGFAALQVVFIVLLWYLTNP
ncbi:hypothetical protein [Gryllotalpicola sp.]|uniref:hypothetical protein n=1 Tax=Gryllotalpicola sp. TaxID=1932787 RepID=UPI00261E270D|nr:hypothetical protein [Gryllotalpicola sp.]